MTTFSQSLAAVSSASVELCDTVCCDCVLYAIGAPASITAIPVIDLQIYLILCIPFDKSMLLCGYHYL